MQIEEGPARKMILEYFVKEIKYLYPFVEVKLIYPIERN